MSEKRVSDRAKDGSTQGFTNLRSPELAPYWLTALIESADDAIISKTLDGIITSWNEGAQRIFGYTAEEVIGKAVTILIPEGHFDEEPVILAKLRAGQRIEHYETVRVRKDGHMIDISLTVSPIKGPDGKIIGASKIARDITEQLQARRALDEASERLKVALEEAKTARAEAERAAAENEGLYRQAEESSRLKEEFLATISHELRTPLSAILGWARMLRLGQLSPEDTTKALDTIERNARAQAQLVDDLLDVSRIITGKLRMDVRPTDPNSFIDAAVEAVRPAAEARGVRVQRVVDTGLLSIPGDPVRLQQVVWNLLSNAIKFTPRDGRVQIRSERVNSHLEIVVSDTGQGISADFLPHVFERFRQADQKTSRLHGGMGLGLAIVRHLVELHGGTVHAESEGEGKGATFTVMLPITPLYQVDSSGGRVHPGAIDLLPADDSTDRLDGLTILVVDDEADTRDLLRQGLEYCGATVKVAGSAGEAIASLKVSVPDILISDIGMPETDGYDFIRQVRNLPQQRGAKLPAIALTAYTRVEDRLHALRAGYDMHVPKPVELTELVAVAISVIRRNS
ncbi:MAG TPA: ATP-binding protein [Pyrinomonadaceae bacterium]|jgi:PAS domain S-box-containing protein|nr:ATP-binding protein [Pyrinomonadaceae bacterium]